MGPSPKYSSELPQPNRGRSEKNATMQKVSLLARTGLQQGLYSQIYDILNKLQSLVSRGRDPIVRPRPKDGPLALMKLL